MTVFILIVAISFFLLSLKKLKFGFFFFIFLIPITPRYIGLTIGSDDYLLSLKRILLMIFLMLLLVLFRQNTDIKKRIVVVYKTHKKIFILMLGLFSLKSLSTFINGFGDISSLIQLFNEFVFTICIFFATLIFVTEKADIEKVFVLITIGVFCSEVIALIEHYKQAPFVDGFIDTQISGTENIKNRYRNNVYRAIGGYDNPLPLAEMLNIAFPVIIYMLVNNIKFFFTNISIFLLLPLSLYYTGSRAGMALFAVLVLLSVWFYYYTHIKRNVRNIFLGFSLLILFVTSFKLSNLGVDVYKGAAKKIYTSGNASIMERVNQYVVISSLISHKPFLGYGFMRNYSNGLDDMSNLDNYYLRLGLEAGFTGIVIFVCMVVYILYLIFQEIKNERNVRHQWLYKTLFLSIFAFVVSKLFLSVPENNVYFYILTAIFLKCKILCSEEMKLSEDTE